MAASSQGIGQALLERTVYDEDGQLVTASFMDYCMPRAGDMPFFHFETRNVPSTTNPLGMKGAGEAGLDRLLPGGDERGGGRAGPRLRDPRHRHARDARPGVRGDPGRPTRRGRLSRRRMTQS